MSKIEWTDETWNAHPVFHDLEHFPVPLVDQGRHLEQVGVDPVQ